MSANADRPKDPRPASRTFLILACVSLLPLVPWLYREARVMFRGARAEGEVLNSYRKGPVGRVAYTFRAADGARWARTRPVAPWSLDRFPVGRRVPVRYDPADPIRSRIRGDAPWLEPNALFLAIPIALLAFSIGLRLASREHR